MEITRATEYAVRCVLHLALAPRDRVVPRREIAAVRAIPEQFLGKIAQRLARAGIIRIHQGARGGYELVASPDRVTLLDVVEAGEGPLSLNKCVMHPRACSRSGFCAVHRIWAEARRQLRDTLARTTFADLAAEESKAARPGCRPPRTRTSSPARARRRGDAERGNVITNPRRR